MDKETKGLDIRVNGNNKDKKVFLTPPKPPS